MERKYSSLNLCIFLFLILLNFSTADIVDDLRNINPEASIEYPEISDIKQDTLIMLFTIDRKNPPKDIINFAEDTKNFIVEFNEIYIESKKADIETMQIVINKMLSMNEKIPKNPKIAEQIDIVDNANRAIEKFLSNQGKWFENLGDKENRTRLKIIYYRNASYAYSLADEFVKSTPLKILSDNLEEKYKKDILEANKFFSRGVEERKKVKINENITVENLSMSEKIEAIVNLNSAKENFEKAKILYEYHYEEASDDCEKYIKEIDLNLSKLQSDVLSFLFLLILGISFIFTYIFIRLNEWQKAVYDERLGEELIQQ